MRAGLQRVGELIERVDLDLDGDQMSGNGARRFGLASRTPPATAT